MSKLIRYPDLTLTLPLQFFGSVSYYALLSSFGHVIIDDMARFDKRRKEVHRTTIVDTRGKLVLTVPVTHKNSSRKVTWNEIGVSTHGEWWNIFLTSLASAYGRTPFFEFYIDRLKPFFDETTVSSFQSIAALDKASDAVIRQILGLDSSISYTSDIIEPSQNQYADEQIENTKKLICDRINTEYYQIRRDKLGFHPDLSILDLIFNLGPESPLYLSQLTK